MGGSFAGALLRRLRDSENALTFQNRLQEACLPVSNPRFSGYQFAAMVAGETFSGYGGFSDARKQELISAETKFDLASLTKLFTAVVAARLFAAGQLDLDAPLASWSGLDFHPTQRNLTARQLLTHVSGLPAEWEEHSTKNATVNSLLKTPSENDSLGKLLYACTGYSLFALALEESSGDTIEVWIERLITEPLGLKSVEYNPKPANDIAVACGPEESIPAGVVHDPRARALRGVSGNAGLFGNSADLLKFAIEVGFGSYGVLEDEARHLLSTPTSSGDWDQAIGFRVGDSARVGPGRRWLSHSGFTGTLMVISPQNQLAGVLLTNRLTVGASREDIAETYRAFSAEIGSKLPGR